MSRVAVRGEALRRQGTWARRVDSSWGNRGEHSQEWLYHAGIVLTQECRTAALWS